MVKFHKFHNGFEYIEIRNQSANAKIALQGAHIFHFARVDEEPLLWLSEQSHFEYGKAIRGGIPVCWPSFGKDNPDLPQHGFARTSLWKVVQTKEQDEQTTKVTLRLSHTPQSLKLWGYRFELELIVTVSNDLILELKTTNLDDKSFVLTQALHSYFDIQKIEKTIIKGLDKKPYFDSLIRKEKIQEGNISFEKEVDVVFQEVDKTVQIVTPERTIDITNEGSSSLIVWNPWIDKSKSMSDLRDDAYLRFVCIESANARDDFRLLKSGKTHILKAKISYLQVKNDS